MNTRQLKGQDLALRLKIERQDDHWLVPSQSGKGVYMVDVESAPPHCSCPDYELRNVKCKHIYAVEYTLEQETRVQRETVRTPDGATTITETVTHTTTATKRVTYRQDWPAYNAAQTHEKALFQDLLADLVRDLPDLPPVPGPGRPRLPLRDMIFAACFKVYSTVSCRRFMSDLADARSKGYLSRAPHFNSVFNYLELPELVAILRDLIERTSLVLKAVETTFAVDSSGFSTCTYERWFDAKYGKEHITRDWLKAHLMVGVTTNIVTSVEITNGFTNDGTMLPRLVNATARNFDMEDVSADMAYSTRRNLEIITRHGATPYIPFKSNAKALSRDHTLWDSLYHYYHLHRETFLQHYHRRSLVESTFNMIKAKFGAAIRSKGEVAQINELLCKVLCHNICVVIQSMYELGIEPNFCADMVLAQK